MAQAGDWQRDVLRELGRQDAAAAGGDTAPGPPETPARRAEPTLRLVRSVPAEASGATDRPEATGSPEAPQPPETPRESGDDRAARPAPGDGTPPGQPRTRSVPGAHPPVQGFAAPPAHAMPVVRPPGQETPGAQPPAGPGPGGRPPVAPDAVRPGMPYAPAEAPRAGHPQAAAQWSGAAGDAHRPDGSGEANRPAEPGGHPAPAPGQGATPGSEIAPGDDVSHAAPAPRGSRSPQTPVRAPDAVPTIDPRLAHALGRPQHGDSVARRTGRSIRKLASSAAQDVAEETRIARELQQPVTTGRVIAVTSIRGGVGKSTTAALLGRTFNHYRHDPVLTLEADAALGTLPVRMGADSVRWAAADLARILDPAMRLTDVTGYLVPVADGGWLLPGSQGRVGAPLDIRTYRTVTLALRRYFAVTVVDCETLPGEVARTAMDTAHARVVVAPMTAEGVNGTRQVLDWLGRLPHSALASTVVALTANSPDLTLDRKTAVAHLKEAGVHVVPLPYDRHLAQGGPIRTSLLGRETRAAAITLAAEVMTRAVRMR
ncbi:hypothetical protein [Streptomyces griseiscabiei]|uniref:MinD-like ATPase involved in chromosome partitioning or flagellar assembly n=1 Tax=Streptomyces griseiscabiei TaxID=2993540 RepID=A0ABU4L007_9ACTN|nr:hypothetical protein [Streptomyces griseiscabiei]MBZ3900874.1 hypothetical protein [Streptomyces griseiscabiei]MDX2908998.1 hypothetical protein [Streptomyces griseiscabiei]